ncbi:helix-turn-helix domain-containing protein [Pontibacterium sp.]|jgi:DNA-binding XRE family transcriptional regulator|uniref:helix-turn-helix domain-containing protein n=1 Tax=Pontibacterium sp. TaxID=2036026 RepID=UPI00356A8300
MTEKPETADDALSLMNEVGSYIDAQAKEIAQLRGQRHLKPFDEVGSTIREARLRQNLTLENLASYSGVSEVTIGKIEKGQVNVNTKKLRAVLKALGMDLWVG